MAKNQHVVPAGDDWGGRERNHVLAELAQLRHGDGPPT